MFGDSELIVNQVRGLYTTKNNIFKSYKHKVWDLIEDFETFNLLFKPRSENKYVDRLAAIGTQYDTPDEISENRKQHYVKVFVRPVVLDNNIHWQLFDSDQQIVKFFREEAEFSHINQEKF